MFIHTSQAAVTIHYARFDNDYEGWNVWAWPDGKEGRAFAFDGADAFGAAATATLPHMDGATKIGVLLRRSAEGDDWAEREADDRYVEELDAGGAAEVWIVQGDPRLYFDRELAMRRRRPRVTEATFVAPDTIEATLNATPAQGVLPAIKLADDGGDVAIREAALAGPRKLSLALASPVDVETPHTLSVDGFGAVRVTLCGLFDDPRFEARFAYDGDDLGATYAPDGTTFRLWAPTASEANVVCYDAPGGTDGARTPLIADVKGTWTCRKPGDLDGAYYTYEVCIEDEWREAVDPYAKTLAANGAKGAIVAPARATPDGWSADERPPFDAPTDAIVYELHVRDATMHPDSGSARPGTYVGLAERGTRTRDGRLATGLDYIAELGVTHVQLLPVTDFVSVDETDPARLYNWGYDPAFYFAPEGSYATDPHDPACRIRELRQLIMAMHARGLRVVLDVVYNHLFSAARSVLEALVPGYYFRTDESGRLANGTGVGNDTASERAMMRKLIVDSVAYWATEFRVDGFRFDLMGIHDVDTMNAVRARLDAIDPSLLLYGEGWHLGTPLEEERKASLANARRMQRIGQFYDRMRDGLKGSAFDVAERGYVSGAGVKAHDVWHGVVGGIDYGRGIVGIADEPEQTVNYVEVHDNHTLWDRLLLSNGEDDDDARRRMQRLATSVILTSQGIAFLHAGQEWCRTKGGEHNSYRSPDTVNRLDWERATAHLEDIAFVRGLIALRRAEPLLRLRTAAAIRAALRIVDSPLGAIVFALEEEGRKLLVAHNALRTAAAIDLPDEGPWTTLCDGNAIDPDGLPLPIGQGRRLDLPPLATIILRKHITA
ncbi:type I pullulanase [Paenibacillus sp. TRM 82003]|nr:type I pullulanase [Paenibacillus sp. TRM 82003]